jgi:zinc transporter
MAGYGADTSGVIWCYHFESDCAGTRLGSGEAEAWLARAAEERPGFLWLHCHLTHAGAAPWLAAHAHLPEAFFETLEEGAHSTRIERVDQSLLAVVNDVRYDFTFEESDVSTLWVHVDRQLVVTARLQPLRSIDRLRTEVNAGETVRSTVDLLGKILRKQADVLAAIVRDVTHQIDSAEDDVLSGRLDQKRLELGQSRRMLVRLQRLLAPEPAAVLRLLQHAPDWTHVDDIEELRGASEEFSVALRDMASLRERIKLLQEEVAAQVSEENNQSLFVLTVVTVLALPINIVAGLFGMNVGGVPLAQHANGFWIVLAILATFTAIVGWLAFRSRSRRSARRWS